MPLQMLPWRQTLYGMDIGRDLGSTVTANYVAPFAFSGQLKSIEYRAEDDREDLAKAAAIESAVQALMTASHKLTEEMYKKATASSAAAGDASSGESAGPDSGKPDEKVVDAEFEEVDKDKK